MPVLAVLGAIIWAAFPSRAESTSTGTLSIPVVRLPVNETIEIGDMRNPLILDAMIDTTIEDREDHISVQIRISAPELYSKLQEALRSRAKSGCSVVHREGSGRGGAELKLCHVADPTITFDEESQSLWLRATARLKAQINGLASDTSDYQLSAEYRASAADGLITLVPRSVNVKGLPGELDEELLALMKSVRVPTDTCLSGVDLRIEDFHLARGADAVTASLAIPAKQALPALLCVANRLLSEASR